jgi:curli production assembly/transport component CsgF
MNIFCKLKMFLLFSIILLLCSNGIFAQQLIYQPINPSFGGNPLGGNWLLTSAQLQDNTTDPSEITEDDPLADFKNSLNRSILNQLTRNLTSQIFGEDGLQEGEFDLGDFSISITETIDGISILIFDLLTGNETTIFIPFP